MVDIASRVVRLVHYRLLWLALAWAVARFAAGRTTLALDTVRREVAASFGMGFALLSGLPDVFVPLVVAGEVAYLGLLGTLLVGLVAGCVSPPPPAPVAPPVVEPTPTRVDVAPPTPVVDAPTPVSPAPAPP